MEIENNPLNGSREEIENWIKQALESWFETKNAISYYPFRSNFQFSKEPFQVLHSIYLQQSREVRAFQFWASPAKKFRIAVAKLLQEPEIYRRDYQVYFELLRLGAEMGSNEVLTSLSMMLQSSQLDPSLMVVVDGLPTEVNILAETVNTILVARFVGGAVTRFLISTFPYIRQGHLSADTILLALARLSPSSWAKYAVELADDVTRHFDVNSHPSVARKAKVSFRQRLCEVVGDENYRKGIGYVEKSGRLAILNWLISPNMVQEQRSRTVSPSGYSGIQLSKDLELVSSKPWNRALGELQNIN